MSTQIVYKPWTPDAPDPRKCSTGDVDTGNCKSCVEYRRLREQNRRERGY